MNGLGLRDQSFRVGGPDLGVWRSPTWAFGVDLSTPVRGGCKPYAMPQTKPQPMTIREAAEYHRVDIKTIRRYIQQGRIKAHRVGPRMLRLDRDSVVNPGRKIGGAQPRTQLPRYIYRLEYVPWLNAPCHLGKSAERGY
jgi:excisionase family DNA binding protein